MTADWPQVAIVGAGYWGRNLVRDFHALGAAKFVLDANPLQVEAMLKAHPGLRAAASFQELLADPQVAALVLATPAETHFRLAEEALKAGKHVFVEKPLALDLAEGRRLAQLAEERGLVLMVDHLLRSHPAYLELERLVAEGALGRVLHIHSRRRSFGKLRTEEDVLWSFAPHDLSMILGLMGQLPEKVSASGGAWISPGLADEVEAGLFFRDGRTARVSVCWLNPVKEQRLMVVGTEKMAVFDDTLPWPEKLKLYPHRVSWAQRRPTAESGPAQPVVLEEASPLTAQCRAFLQAISGGPAPRTDGREGLRVLTLLSALSASLRDGGRPQPLTDAEPDYFVHPSAVLDEGVSIGRGTKIWHFSHILSGSQVGEDCNIGQNVVLGPRVKIGRKVKIQNNVSVYEGVSLEDEVFCGPSMVFTNVINPRSAIVRKDEYRPTVVRRGASIGANATVVCGHSLGRWSFIAAGAVVTTDVPDYALMVGVPARRQGWVCRCGVRLPETLLCPDCGRRYRQSGETLSEDGSQD